MGSIIMRAGDIIEIVRNRGMQASISGEAPLPLSDTDKAADLKCQKICPKRLENRAGIDWLTAWKSTPIR